jgi:hypothetical protein
MADNDVTTLSVVNKADHDVIVSNRFLFPAGETVEVTVEQQQFVTQILACQDLEARRR